MPCLRRLDGGNSALPSTESRAGAVGSMGELEVDKILVVIGEALPAGGGMDGLGVEVVAWDTDSVGSEVVGVGV